MLTRTDRRSEKTPTTRDKASLKRARPARTLEELLESHGPDMYSMALIILGDRAQSEAVVVQVLFDALDRPLLDAHEDSRRHLARCVYLRCTRTRLGSGQGTDSLLSSRHWPDGRAATRIMTGLAVLSGQQRAALALSLYGEHGFTQIADVMSLPAPVVAELLRSGLGDLARMDVRGD